MSEFLPTNEAIVTEAPKESIAADPTTQADAANPPINGDMKKKKKPGILKAALLILRKSSSANTKEKKKSLTKQKSNDMSTNTKWTKLVGSMRPLHMQETANSPTRPVAEQHPQQNQQQQEVIAIAPASPAPSSSRGTISAYASASSLRDLYSDDDEEEEEEDPDQVFDAICGDEMIDAKAEEFIAQFYKQIQLQNSNTAHHHHRRN